MRVISPQETTVQLWKELVVALRFPMMELTSSESEITQLYLPNSLGVDFYPFNIGFLRQDIADLTFNTTYESPKEHRISQ